MSFMIRGILLLTIGWSTLLTAMAQKNEPESVNKRAYQKYLNRTGNSHYIKVPLEVDREATAAVEHYLLTHLDHLKNGRSELQLILEKESPGGYHYTFNQVFNGLTIYDATIKVNLDKSHRITSIFDNSFATDDWDASSLQKTYEALDIARATSEYLDGYSRSAVSSTSTHVLVNLLKTSPGIAIRVKVEDATNHAYKEALLDPSGDVLLERDLIRYAAPQDSIANGMIFLPCPLTTAQKQYQSPYIDSSDNDVAVINAERKSIQMTVDYSGGVFRLDGPYAIIVDIDAPNYAPPTSATGDFNFNRSEPGFEAVNAYYHIHNYQAYLQSLGFTSLVDFPVNVDAHAFGDADQSGFLSSNPQKLYFGTGGVDDGEDADVVIHEYGHAISFNSNGNPNSKFERKALDEAVGDYLAASFSKSKSEFRWEDVFTWDGHNEYWGGRSAASEKHYPEDLGSSYHLNGEIFASVMMEINEELGRTVADKLMIQSLYSWSENMNMVDAGQLLIDADTLLYGGANYCVLHSYLFKRGLRGPEFEHDGNTYTLTASEDIAICPGSTTTLEAHVTGFPNPTFSWIGDNFELIDDSTVSITPDSTATYTVRVLDDDGCFLEEEITIEIGGARSSPTDTICAGDTTNIFTSGGNSYQWSPAAFMDDPTKRNPNVFPPASMHFKVDIIVNSQCTHTDSVYVVVNHCKSGISMRNMENFSMNKGPLYVLLPPDIDVADVFFYDMQGRTIFRETHIGNDQIVIKSNGISKGVYMLQVVTQFDENYEKVVKFR